ncbi:hypothetical protein H6P81_010006 [Aristolochia fimbriata]|uniref:Aminotransferase-like plant mobile domain-containing protein n=1 Tax=Aristolochia fimbriata TaxID=158543 RepID=A0AAV7EQC8_ARIFI|nr:hypothetical protein H6P81_010006 [Aristolochia fimbriata]
MVFKVASYMATGVRFALAGPALACLYKGLGQAVAGWPSIAQWPYLYSWLAVYFHTHGEDLGRAHRPGMVSFGNPSLRRTFDDDQAHNLFRRLPVPVWNRYPLGWSSVSSLVDEPKLKKPLPKAAYESLLSVRCCFLTIRRSIRYFIEPYNLTRFARQFGYCQDLPGDLGVMANRRDVASLSELMTLWRASVVGPCGRLDLPLSREPTRDPGTTLAYYNWWKERMSPRLEQNRLELGPTISAAENSDEEEDYDNDRSHPRRRRPQGKKKAATPLVKKKRAPLATLSDTSATKKPRKEVPLTSFASSPPTILPPISETEPHTVPLISCPPENPPVETVLIASSLEAPEAPQVEVSSSGAIAQTNASVVAPLRPEALHVREAAPPIVQEVTEEVTIEEEVPAPVLQEVGTALVPSGEDLVEVEVEVLMVQEALAAVEEVPEVVPAAEDTPEVGSAVDDVPEVTPVVGEATIVQNLATPLTLFAPPILTSEKDPSQQFLSYVEARDVYLLADAEFVISSLQEVSHNVTRLQVYTQQLQALREIESLAGKKLEDAKLTLSEVTEELLEAKVDEEDARERLKLASEQLQSAGTKVAYLTTQAEQIQESVRDLEKAVIAYEQMVAEIIARPALSAAEEATLLSSRAAFAELQQEIARNL